jgi:hypothetical protein
MLYDFSRFQDLETAREKSVDGFNLACENGSVDVDCARLLKNGSGPALGTVGFRQNAKPVEELTPGCVPRPRDVAPASTTGFSVAQFKKARQAWGKIEDAGNKDALPQRTPRSPRGRWGCD